MRPWLGLVLVPLCVAACASDQPREHRGHFEGRHGDADWGEHHGGRASSLFISPAGQPFRGQGDDPYPVAAWFAAADADHDGRLTRQELRADFQRFFQQLDADHDGVLDGPEITAYEHQVAPEILASVDQGQAGQGGRSGGGWSGGQGRGGGRMGGRGGHRRGGDDDSPGGAGRPQRPLQGAQPYSLTPVIEPVSSADADFDGKVTLAEFLAASDRRFDEIDAAEAGYLRLQGLPKTPVQSMHRHRRRAGDED